MKDIGIGEHRYRIVAGEHEGKWQAHAERADNGDRYGVECVGDTESEAIARVEDWLAWQVEHAAALEALQLAERAYHRTIVGSAFANSSEGPTAVELQKESLDALEAARGRLDEVRARKPE